ncbi:MAG TPA: triple tyrosine motif-containing protein, partial [Bacteroidales bacterium]|nr:triple tyrosine motif-containing protein [Bacteroidales bacterium]
LDILADRRGRLWLATNEGLFITDSSGSIIYKQAHTVKTAKLLNYSADTILCIFGNQLQIFSTAGKPVLLDTLMFANARAFCKTGIYCWFGTPFGLYIADVSDGIKSLRNVFVHRPIHPEAVYALLLHEGIIWSATDHGIKRYSVAGKLLPALPVTQELLNHVIYALVPDQLNRIWFSSNRGIGCISEKRDRIIWFNTRNNLQSLEFNSNAFLRNQQGWIYFGGINGINGLNPQHFNPVKTMPEIRLITLSISDTSYSGGIPPEHLHLDIDWRSPHVSGSVFTTDYLNPEMQQFSFYLEGYQSGWGKMSSDPSFSYRNLPPGKYRLLVKCTDAYKNISGEVCLLTIRIKPPFWKTWWFAIFSAIALLCITILIVRKLQEMRYRDKLHKLEKQNAVNRERLRIAKDMHDEVGASLTRISILSELAKNGKQSQEESMKTISQISDISGNVVDEMSEIIWAMNPKNDSLDSFAAYLRRYASGYLETAGIEGRFPFPDDIQPVAMSSELRRNVFLTAKEALHNMVKHSGATEAEVRLEYYGKKLELSLRDNGNGFDIESKTGSGNGLINMQKRIQELGGEFSVTSTVGKGTEVRLVVILG